ncbi:MAG: circadian clock protein KaiC [Pseudomonadota bacterium]|nr:circadian clock protein KaiC [Pseudomonadota bacterium]
MNVNKLAEKESELVRTGIAGLDDVLVGGLPPNRVYLVHGNPGSGKTTLALQYLLEGVRQGEKVLYVTLSETKEELLAVARSHGWSLERIQIYEMATNEQDLEPENQFTMYQPSEVELNVTTKAILAEFEKLNPSRVALDSLSEIRLLAQNPLRYRRQILALKQYFAGRQCTVLMLDDKTSEIGDLQLESITHGVISLEQMSPAYGASRRRLSVTKMRGIQFRGGYHDFIIEPGGLQVFPRLIAAEHDGRKHKGGQLQSGIRELDMLLGGGIEWGTSILLVGPAGTGKSSTALQYAISEAAKGHRSAIFAFDERIEIILERAAGLGMDLETCYRQNLVTIQSVDPAELSPGEFGHYVRMAAEGEDGRPAAKIIIIDSLNGYLNAMPEERFLIIQLHELLTYLGHKGIVSFLIVAQHGLLSTVQSPLDTSYLADSVMMFRYFEVKGEVKQAISVVKKRSGHHERTIREFRLVDKQGIVIGEPLRQFKGVLTSTPEIEDATTTARRKHE